MNYCKSLPVQLLILVLALILNTSAQQRDLKELETECDRMLSEQFKADEPGSSVLIARNGKIIYKKAFGMADLELNVPMRTDNVFRIGSITKQFTAVAVLQLMEQGKLDLQDDITKYIPGYSSQGYKITIENLLTHTSGIRSYSDMKDSTQRGKLDFTPGEMIDYFKNEPIRFAPGTKWEYSNSNYFLLGYIIETISGSTYGEYLQENIFKPLGMNNSRYADDKQIVTNRTNGYTAGNNGFENAPYLSMTQPYAAGSILSTVEDLLKWNQAVQSFQLIKKETLQKALSRYKLKDGKETNYGYGWRMGYVYDSPSLWHGGLINGFITVAMYLPEEDVFVAVFSNCDCNSPQDITSRLAALAIGKLSKGIEPDEKILETYVGEYQITPEFTFIVTKEENKLFVQAIGQEQFEIAAETNTKFFSKVNDARFEFIADHSGKITKVILNQGGRQADAEKIK